MAFSAETLNPLFDHYKESYFLRDENSVKNAELAYDYLSGKEATLPVFHAAHFNREFSQLATLFAENPEWTSNDDLLLALLLEPSIHAQVERNLDRPILFVFSIQNQEKAFKKCLTIFKKLNYTDDEILSTFITFVDSTEAKNKTTLSNYIISGIQKSSANFFRSLSTQSHFYNSNWNYNIYAWLELASIEKATGYLNNAMITSDFYRVKEIVVEILSEDYRKFIPFAETYIGKMIPNSLEMAGAKFELQLLCYNYNPEKDPALVFDQANQYLEVYISQHLDLRYERGLTIEGEQVSALYKISNLALFFVMKTDPDKALNLIQRILDANCSLNLEFLEFIKQYFPTHTLPSLLKALQLNTTNYSPREYYGNIMELLKEFPPEKYIHELRDLDKFKSKMVKEIIALHLATKDPEAVPNAIALLNHKKGDIRFMAVFILANIGSPEAVAALSAALDKEKNDDARDAILYSIGESLYEGFKEENIPALIAKCRERGKLAKPVTEWLDESHLPPIYLKSGRELTQEEVRFIVYRMSRVKEMRSDLEAKLILNLVDREKSSEFAKKIFKLFGEKEYEAKYKYLIALAALTGNQDMVDKFRSAINEWIDKGRKVMSEYGIGGLAIQGSDKALRWVEWYSRKYRSKKAYVGQTALSALQNAADELGITMHELGDRVIPDFGFDGLFKSFEAGGEEYRAFIDSNFKLAFFNEDNKKIKSVPASTSAELKEEFKNIAKEVKDIVKSQSIRLEHYLVVQRKWSLEAWHKFFQQNPVMFIYATKLLWVVYKEDKIENYFICQEDTTLTDVKDEEISIDDDSYIAMAHPYYLSPEELKAWQKKFFDLSIDPIFPQLERPFTRVEEKDLGRKIIQDLSGTEVDNGAIRSTLERKGWGKGATGDGGFVNEFVKDDYESGIQAILEVEGVFVGGYGNDYEPKLGRLYFLDKKIKKGNSSWFNYPKDEEDERLIPLKDLPPVFYSEIIADAKSIKVKSKQIV